MQIRDVLSVIDGDLYFKKCQTNTFYLDGKNIQTRHVIQVEQFLILPRSIACFCYQNITDMIVN